MFLKLFLSIGILVIGSMMFSSEIHAIFPNTATSLMNSLKKDMTDVITKAFVMDDQKAIDLVKSNVTDYVPKAEKDSQSGILDSVKGIFSDLFSKSSYVPYIS